MDCRQAEPLIPGYLDGELSEASAAPLRRHLLDCQACRGGAQGEKNLKRWFAAEPAVAVPHGFAARVARRAFAGDAGESPLADRNLEPQRAGPGALAASFQGGRDGQERILQFVLGLTAAAALVVIALAMSMRSWSLPAGTSLQAADGRDEISVDEAIDRLDRLNQAELRREVAPTAPLPSAKDRRP
jgi:hypothetical protein